MKVNHHGFLVEQFQNERLILKGVAMKDKKRKFVVCRFLN